MSYALIQNGAVQTYPYSYAMLRAANPDVSFPREVSDEWLLTYGIHKVATVEKPADTASTNFTEGAPTLVSAIWTQTWTEVPATAEQIAERAKASAKSSELSAAKLDAWITSYLAMTPEQARQYVLDNSATLAALRTNTARLAYAVRVLIRGEFDV